MASMDDTNMTSTKSSDKNKDNTEAATMNAASHSTTHNTEGLSLNPQDVLLGRGDWTVRYEGNVRFRDLIREKRNLFGSASGRSARDLIASDIIRIIRDRGGRFLRKETDAVGETAVTTNTTTANKSSSSSLPSPLAPPQKELHPSEGGSKRRANSTATSGTSGTGNDHNQEISPMDGAWIEVDKKTAMKKVKQAFRDKDSWTQKLHDVPSAGAAAVVGSQR